MYVEQVGMCRMLLQLLTRFDLRSVEWFVDALAFPVVS